MRLANPLRVTPAVVRHVVSVLEDRLRQEEYQRDNVRATALKAFNVRPPLVLSTTVAQSALNRDLVRAWSELVERAQLSLTAAIRLWRGQSMTSPRPNKALLCEHLSWLLHGFEKVDTLLASAQQGVSHNFKGKRASVRECTNHQSAMAMKTALLRSIADGQTSGTYFVVNATVAKQ